MTEELKPCPFCGWPHIYIAKRLTASDRYLYGAGCKGCKVQFGPYNDTKEEAIEQWNRRVGE